jgi:hypothetical protein
MQSYRLWLENQMGTIDAKIFLDFNRHKLMITTSDGSFDLDLTLQQMNDLTQKIQAIQNPTQQYVDPTGLPDSFYTGKDVWPPG